MKNYLYLILGIFIILGCSEDNEEPITEEPTMEDPATETSSKCLDGFELDVRLGNCQTEYNGECILTYIGSSVLSTESKSNFINFCLELDSTFSFVNDQDKRLECKVTEKTYETLVHSITKYSEPCEEFCMDNEGAEIIYRSDRFSLRIELIRVLTRELNNMNEWVYEPATIYAIKAIFDIQENGGSKSQFLFQLPIEDKNYDPILDPDTTRIRFHESISLNNLSYSNVYSNENKEIGNGYTRKEKVYFNVEEGLIAVRDSFGVLWTIEN